MASTPQSQHFVLQCIIMMPGRSAHHVVAQALASLGQLCLSCAQVLAGTGELPDSACAQSPHFKGHQCPHLNLFNCFCH